MEVYAFAVRVCAVSIIGMLLEYIMPEGRLKSGVEKAVGLAVLWTIAEPVIAFIS